GDMRALVDMGISYNQNADQVMQIAQDVCAQMAKEDEDIVEGPIVEGLEMIEDNKMVLRVSAQTKNMMKWGVQRNLWKAVKESLDANDNHKTYENRINVVTNEKSIS